MGSQIGADETGPRLLHSPGKKEGQLELDGAVETRRSGWILNSLSRLTPLD